MNRTTVGTLTVLIAVSAGEWSTAACPQLAGRWGYGAPGALAVSGNHAYFGSGSVLMVADLTNPASVPVVGRVQLPDSIRGVAVSGSHVYVGANRAGLRVIDVANPTLPIDVGSFDPGSYAVGLAVAGNYVYLADGWDGLRVIDVSNPASPVEVGAFPTPTFARDIAVAGHFAYVATAGAGLFVVDITNPASPTGIGSLITPGNVNAVAASGNRVYAGADDGLHIIDVSTPAAPTEVGLFAPACRGAADVALVGSQVFTAGYGCGLTIVNAADPTSPVEVGHLDVDGVLGAVAVSGHVAVASDLGGNILFVDVTTPASPATTFTIPLPEFTRDVAIDGEHAFLANGQGGIRVIATSVPAHPAEIASLDTLGEAYSIAIQDHLAYLATNGTGLHIVDVTNPSAPVARGTAAFGGTGFDVTVEGGFVFVARGSAGLAVVDVSDPVHPAVAATLPLPGNSLRVATVAGYALIADTLTGLRVIDVSPPTAPTQVADLPIVNGAESVVVAGTLAYVGDTNHTISVVDVADPVHPALVTSLDGFSNPRDLAVSNGFLYVAQGDSGIVVVSLADPLHPEIVGQADTPGQASGIAAANGLVAVADDVSGAAFFDVSTCPSTLCTLSCSAGATPAVGLAPLGVHFNAGAVASSCGDGTSFDWDFGDGSPHSAAQNPTHTYASTGSFPWAVVVSVGFHHTTCSATVVVAAPPPRHFDFGTPTSPVAAGYTRVSHNSVFSGAAGFGWSHGVLGSRDRGIGSDLLRDLVFSPDAGFALLLADGSYDVTVTMGDASGKHDQMALLLEGRQVDSVSTNAGQFATRTQRVSVGDGGLDVTIDDLGGADPNAVINALVVINAAPFRFDFGTPSSPVANGYTQVTHTTAYDERLGYGWLSGTVGSRDRVTGTLLSRDFNFTPLGTYVVDVASGTYDVVVTMGDKTSGHDQMGVLLEGVLVDTVSTAAGTIKSNRYRVQVNDGQFTLTLDDLGGSDPNVVINALEIYGSPTGAPGTVPSVDVPKDIEDHQTVTSTIELTGVPGTIADVNVTLDIEHTFDADVRAALIAPDNTRVVLLEAIGGDGDDFTQTTLDDEASTAISAGAAPFAGSFRPIGSLAALDGKSPNGTWTLEITDVASPDEGALNSWSLTVVTALAPPSKRFDFGTPTSPLAAGYTRVAHTTSYTGALGYGWLSGAINSRDRGAGGDLNRDFCFTPMGTFVADLPSGTYDVTVISGDAAGKHDQMAISIEGVVAATVTANAGQYPATTVRKQVTDGQLTVLLKDNGGSDVNVVINALDITPVTP